MMVMNWLEILQSPVRVQASGPMNVSHTVNVSDFTRMFISDIGFWTNERQPYCKSK